MSIPLGELPEEARAWERGVDELAEEDEDVADYVRALEETRDTTDLPEASGEAIAREFERYLKRRGETRPSASDERSTRGPRRGAHGTVAPASGLAAVRQAVGAERRVGPGVDSGHRGRRVEVGRPGRASTASTTGAAGAPAPTASARRQRSSRSTDPTAGRRSTPSRCGSGGAAASAGSPSGRPRCCGARRRRPGCPCDFDIFSPS